MKLTFIEACEAVADVFENNPKMWCRGAYARDSFGREVSPNHPTACQWCVLGALYAATNGDSNVLFDGETLLNRTASELYGKTFLIVNDTIGREAAIKVLRAAVERGQRK